MFSRPAVATFALAVAELFVLTRVASILGTGTTLLLLVGLSLLGVVLLKRVGAGLLQASVSSMAARAGGAKRTPESSNFADQGMGLLAAVLLIIPGFLTGLLGFLLYLPPIRAAARPVVLHRIQPWIQPNLQFGRVRWFGREVVDVDLVDVDDHSDDSSHTHKPELS